MSSGSRNKHSWWWDSHISPKNSKWLAENVEEMDQSVKRMLKLIENDGDSFAKKAEMYYKNRPELVSHVEEFYRMYRSLAERYDNVTSELRKNIPSDLQFQGSGVSDVGSKPPSITPGSKPRPRSTAQAPGFEFLIKSYMSSSDGGTTELDSESELHDLSFNHYLSAPANSDWRGLKNRITELESELKKFHLQQEEINVKKDNIEEELRVDENENLKIELQKYMSISPQPVDLKDAKAYSINVDLEATFFDQEHKIRALEADLKVMREKLNDSEDEVKRLRHELQELVTKMLKERAFLDDTIKKMDLRCQCSDHELQRLNNVKAEMEGEIEKLNFDELQ